MGGYRQLRAVAKLPVCEHAMRRQYLRAEAAGTEQRRHDMRVALGEQQAIPRQPISMFAAVAVAPIRHRMMEADWIVRIGNARSEGRRVGQECVSTCRSRWEPY